MTLQSEQLGCPQVIKSKLNSQQLKALQDNSCEPFNAIPAMQHCSQDLHLLPCFSALVGNIQAHAVPCCPMLSHAVPCCPMLSHAVACCGMLRCASARLRRKSPSGCNSWSTLSPKLPCHRAGKSSRLSPASLCIANIACRILPLKQRRPDDSSDIAKLVQKNLIIKVPRCAKYVCCQLCFPTQGIAPRSPDLRLRFGSKLSWSCPKSLSLANWHLILNLFSLPFVSLLLWHCR